MERQAGSTISCANATKKWRESWQECAGEGNYLRNVLKSRRRSAWLRKSASKRERKPAVKRKETPVKGYPWEMYGTSWKGTCRGPIGEYAGLGIAQRTGKRIDFWQGVFSLKVWWAFERQRWERFGSIDLVSNACRFHASFQSLFAFRLRILPWISRENQIGSSLTKWGKAFREAQGKARCNTYQSI